MTGRRDAVLVSWVSVNHGATPFLDALKDERSLLYNKIGTLYLCYRDALDGDPSAAREKAVMDETVRVLRRELQSDCPKIVWQAWKTSRPPTDHEAILEFAEDVLKKARRKIPKAPIYIYLSPGTPAMHAVWLALAGTGCVSEPVHLVQGIGSKDRKPGDAPVAEVDFRLNTWLRRYRDQRPARAGTDDDGHLWDPTDAKSAALRRAMADVRRFAPLRVPVLLLGERGTGKTTLAAQLRARSPFQGKDAKNWPIVVCGQFRVNPQLARSELFGHSKGAFTGAVRDRPGLLESADGDTLFLDEIGDIDRDTQRLLLAAIEGRGFTRLGDSEVRNSRFRLVCATNRRLEELRGGLLDEDFYDRLAMFVIRVPALRECREDLPGIWTSVLHRARKVAEVEPEGWLSLADHPAILDALQRHPLSGNLRDLQRLAYHGLAALESGVDIDAAVSAALETLDRPAGAARSSVDLASRLPLPHSLDEELAQVEASWLRAALEVADGNKSEAARLVGLKRKTFADRVKRRLSGDVPPP